MRKSVVFKGIHHIAFAVSDLDAAIRRFERLTGFDISERGTVPSRGAEIAIFKFGDTRLELLAPAGKNGSLQKFIEEHGEGFFHIAFSVEDVEEAFRQMQHRGVKMAGPPYVAFKNWRIAYLDPEETAGIYTHIIDEAAE